jgi:hypothetical protein
MVTACSRSTTLRAAGDLSPYELLAGLRLRVPHVYADA